MKITTGRAAFIKFAIGLFAFLLSVGPSMLCIGIALMTSPSGRIDRVDTYNDFGAQYNATLGEKRMANWGNASAVPRNLIGGVTPTVSKKPVNVFGDTDRVHNFAPTVAEATVPFPANASSAINVDLYGLDSFAIAGFPITARRASTAICTPTAPGRGCSAAQMTTYCRTTYGANASFTGGGCVNKGTCNECEYDSYLAEICVVVTGFNNTVREWGVPSCFYPFSNTAAKYQTVPAAGGAVPTTVKVSIRSLDDPFLYLQQISRGTEDFGPNRMGERMSGYGLLISGALMSLIFLFLVYSLYDRYNEAVEEQELIESRRIKTTAPDDVTVTA